MYMCMHDEWGIYKTELVNRTDTILVVCNGYDEHSLNNTDIEMG